MKKESARILGFVLLVAAAALAHHSPVGTRLDFSLLDMEQRLLRSLETRPVSADAEVVVIGFNDATTKAFREPMTLWHPHLGRFFEAMAEVKPKVVGLDIILPDRSYDFLLPGYDRALLKGVMTLRRSGVPLVLGLQLDEAGQTKPLFPPLLSLAGRDAVGLVTLTTDVDHVVRRLWGLIEADGGELVPTLSGRMAQKAGVEPRNGLIDYTRGEAFSFLPLEEVMAWWDAGDLERLRRELGGKAVLMGGIFPYEDRHASPVPLAADEPGKVIIPGVYIQAQALRNLLGGNFLHALSPSLALGVVLLGTLMWWFGHRTAVGISLLVSGGAIVLGVSLWGIGSGLYLPVATALATAFVALTGRMSLEGFFHYREKRQLQNSFGRYVSPAVVKDILAGRIKPGVGGERRTLCVLFSDIRNFTYRSEGQTAEETIALLNRYLTEMTASIHEQGGTIDKFIGDGIMAFFGAPNPMENPATAACNAALDMFRRLEGLNAQLAAEGIAPIYIGVGLKLGDAVVGNVGAETRHEYTAIGDTVNVASRLEGLTKQVGYPLVVSQEVMTAVADHLQLEFLGEQPIKGHTPVPVYGWRPEGFKYPEI